MTASSWITMIAILLFVWGGFAVALTIAVRKEAGKRAAGLGEALPPEDRFPDSR